MRVPSDFLLGAATSSFQIEGALTEDGRGPSIWDNFPALLGHNGSVACDHYHRVSEDVGILKELGVDAYRFSLAWPRILPEGRGRVNQAGLDFYSRLVDELLENEIQPWATLYHWDLPLTLHDEGGWKRREIAEDFAEYTTVVLDRLGDRVKHWFTLNEPWCVAILGYQTGEHAPGEQCDEATVLRVIHNLMLSHAASLERIRGHGNYQAGIVLNPWLPLPVTDSPADIEAADRAWVEQVGWWFQPLFLGKYPAEVWSARQGNVPEVQDGDLERISAPTDFLGLNLYFPGFVRAAPDAPHGYERCEEFVHLPRTDMGWQIYSPIMSYCLREVHRRYSPRSIYITENGCAVPDITDDRGQIHDLWRQEYHRHHLRDALDTREDGVPLDGYFAWSLMDNFEWQYGYTRRFGLYFIDYVTLERIPKASARWYSRLTRQRRL